MLNIKCLPIEPRRAGNCPAYSVNKPRKIIAPLSAAESWQPEAALYQVKLDGQFAVQGLGGHTFAGELIGQSFFAFDVVRLSGEDCRHFSTIDRWRALQSLAGDLTAAGFQIVPSAADGAGLLRQVLASGGEGVVAKQWHASYDDTMEACKRLETFYCVVTGFNAGQSVRLAFTPPFLDSSNQALPFSDLEPAGNMPLRSPRIDNVRVGSVLKVEACGRHKSGLLREARPCKDTPTSWLVRR